MNFVFSRLMSKAAGDIDYTGAERLVCAAGYQDKPGCETELQLIQRESGVPAETAEAAYLARRIRELVEGGFSVTEQEGERPIRYGDICILLRSANRYAHAYAQELSRLGVPARATVTGGFFAAPEVQVVLSLLQVVDNPNQDIPLLAVLMSPLYGFSADDAARLRAGDKKVSLYASLTGRRQGRTPGASGCSGTWPSCGTWPPPSPSDTFLTQLYGPHRLPRHGPGHGGRRGPPGQPPAAAAVRRGVRGAPATTASPASCGFSSACARTTPTCRPRRSSPQEGDAVAVMSIHKSKGLEFPVCIVAGCGRNFVSDQREDVLLHPELGLGVKLRDAKRSARYTTTVREAIALETARSAGAEELRVLYVAMTRAKEKLILVASGDGMDRTLEKLGMELMGGGVSPYSVRKGKNAAQWLLLCALCHPDGGELRKLAGGGGPAPVPEDYTPWRVGWSRYEPAPAAEQPQESQPAAPDMDLYQRLRNQVDFTYPYSGALGVPAKVAASKLAAEQGASREISLPRPAWLGEQGMTPAQRGTALHEFMQFADFPAAAKDPEQELQRLVAEAYLTPEQAAAVDRQRVRKFFAGDLGQRVLRSPQVEKERRFTAVIPPSWPCPSGARPRTPGRPWCSRARWTAPSWRTASCISSTSRPTGCRTPGSSGTATAPRSASTATPWRRSPAWRWGS